MESTELTVLCLIGTFVIGINVALFQAIRRSSKKGELELLRKAARRARNPWEAETADLEKLSQLVAPFKEKNGEEITETGEEGSRPSQTPS